MIVRLEVEVMFKELLDSVRKIIGAQLPFCERHCTLTVRDSTYPCLRCPQIILAGVDDLKSTTSALCAETNS